MCVKRKFIGVIIVIFPSQIECSIHLLKGYIYEASDNRALAAESFQTAAQEDPLCFEAIHALTQHHMLTAKEGMVIEKMLSLCFGCVCCF